MSYDTIVDWRPIETAPKKGLILLHHRLKKGGHWRWEGPIVVGHWWPKYRVWSPAYSDEEIEPTHWAPLPTRPVEYERRSRR